MMRPPIGLEDFVSYALSRKLLPPPGLSAPAGDGQEQRSRFADALQLWRAVSALQRHSDDFRSLIDVGPYRDDMNELLHHFFPQEFVYLPIIPEGPQFDAPGLPVKFADCALLLDVIDRLSNPIPCLDAINRALRPGGTLILVTKNLTSLPRAYRMLVWGQSPNAHPARPHVPPQGKLRAPLREFSAGELAFFLRLSGFTVAEQHYFQRESGAYRQCNDGTIVRMAWYEAIKTWPHRLILWLAPHFADRQLVVATRTEAYEDVVKRRPQPTSSMSEWLRMCAEHGV